MHYVELVALVAILQYLAFGALAGNARQKSGLKAPAVSGHEGFERMYRVQMNTLETLVAFLPALFLSAQYAPAIFVAGLGVIYLIGRTIYWRSYVESPAKRGLGFMLSIIPTFALIVVAIVGNVMALFG